MPNKISNGCLSPLNQRRINIFRQNRRAWWSFVLFCIIFGISLLAELLANDQPLVVKYQGEYYFPIVKTYNEQTFGGDFPTPADYRDPYIRNNINANGYMLFPPLPYSFNTVDYELDTPTPSAPSRHHWLGTDDEGRDILARIIYGLRISVVLPLFSPYYPRSSAFCRSGSGIFRRQNRYFLSTFSGDMGGAAPAFRTDYRCQHLRSFFLDVAHYNALLYMDEPYRRCPRRISSYPQL